MAQTCKKCGYVTEQVLANRCALCKEPYGTSGSNLSAIAAANSATSVRTTSDQAQPTASTSRDTRNWLVKSIHSRSIGGMILAVIMIAGGLMGSGMTRGNMTVTGAPLAGAGFLVLLISSILFFATKRR